MQEQHESDRLIHKRVSEFLNRISGEKRKKEIFNKIHKRSQVNIKGSVKERELQIQNGSFKEFKQRQKELISKKEKNGQEFATGETMNDLRWKRG